MRLLKQNLLRKLKNMKQKVKTSASNSFVYALACGIRRSLRQALKEREERQSSSKVVITLRPQGPPRGNVLFSYIIDGFLLEPGVNIPSKHTNIWQSLKMAETFVPGAAWPGPR